MKSLSWLFLALFTFLSYSPSVRASDQNFAKAAVEEAAKEAVKEADEPAKQDSTMKAEAPGFVVLPGDILQVTVWKEDGLDREVMVLMDGSMTFPLVGTVNVQNMTPTAVQDILKAKLSSMIPDATVTVAIKAPLGHKVSVLGQVQKPGDIILSSKMGVMQALSQAGGLTPFADEGDIIVIRQTEKGRESIEFPYDDVSKGDDLDKDFDLRPGDVVVVPTAWIL